MHYSTFKFALDLQVVQSQVSIPVKFGDTAIRLYITLTDGGVPFTLTEGFLAVLSGVKSDGNKLFNNCMIDLKNSAIIYDFTEQTATSEGITQCEIILYNPEGKVLGTPRFIILVDNRLVYDASIASEEEADAIDYLIVRAQETEAMVNEAEEGRKLAEDERNEVFQRYSKGVKMPEYDPTTGVMTFTTVDDSETQIFDVVPTPFTSKDEGRLVGIDANGELVATEIEYSESAIKAYANNSFSNALKSSQVGDVVAIDDVSPIPSVMRVKAKSKNVFPFPYHTPSKTEGGVTMTANDDGSISFKGTSTTTWTTFNLTLLYELQEGTYTCHVSGMTNCKFVAYNETDSTSYTITDTTPYTFTAKKGDKFTFYVSGNRTKGTTYNETVYPMLVKGTTAPISYQPYLNSFDGISLYRQPNRLLFTAPDIAEFTELNYLGYENGYIGRKDVKAYRGKTITYSVYYYPTDGDAEFFTRLFLFDEDGNELPPLDGNSITPGYGMHGTSSITYTIADNVAEIGFGGVTYHFWGDFVSMSKQKVEFGNSVSGDEQYTEPTIFEIGEGGVVDNVASVYPVTVLYTNSPRAVVEVECNRDINKAFEELYNAIIAQGGNL